MQKYFEWLNNRADRKSTQDEILENQLDQLIIRIEGLLHDVPEKQKTALVDKLMKQIEERLLGL